MVTDYALAFGAALTNVPTGPVQGGLPYPPDFADKLTAIRAYMAESWRRISSHIGAWPSAPASAAWQRMMAAPILATPSGTVASVASQGPNAGEPGATQFASFAVVTLARAKAAESALGAQTYAYAVRWKAEAQEAMIRDTTESVKDTVREGIKAAPELAREAADRLQWYTAQAVQVIEANAKTAQEAAGGLGFGFGLGVGLPLTIIGLGAAGIYFAPEIGAAFTAKHARARK